MKYIDFKNYEIQKVISEQLRTLAWTIAAIYTYLGITHNKVAIAIIVLIMWVLFMWFSLVMLTHAEKLKHRIKGENK